MGENTKIEWAHHTFNPWIGCVEVSDACDHCYAKKLATRMRDGSNLWGPEGERRVTNADYWRKPLRWAREAAEDGERRRVFCASLADVFEDRPDLVEPRGRLWALIAETPQLDWLLLTKRPQNIEPMAPIAWYAGAWPAHVWLGVTTENQARADERIPQVIRTPAPIVFISAEPLLGPIRVPWWRFRHHMTDLDGTNPENVRGIAWVIAGGESGSGARPTHPDWFRELRDDCVGAGTAFHFKQWGEWSPTGPAGAREVVMAADGTVYDGSDLTWPDGPRCAAAMRAGHDRAHLTVMRRVGKRAAGRELDWRTWDEAPATPVAVG